MKKLKLVTHADLDGAGCAIVIKQAFEPQGYEVDVVPASYASLEKTIRGMFNSKDKADKYIMTDISPETRELLDLWLSLPESEVIDHHASRAHYNGTPGVTIVSEHEGEPVSATRLCELRYIDYCDHNPEYLPQVLSLINQWDVWLWPNNTKEAQNSVLELQGLYSQLGMMSFLEVIPELLNDGKFSTKVISAILDADTYKLNRAVKQAMENIAIEELWWEGQLYRAGFVFTDSYQSIVAERVMSYYKRIDEELDVLFLIGSNTVSLRSKNKDLDLTGLARVYGGGGHKSAAGFPIVKSLKDRFIGRILQDMEKN